MRFVRTRHQRTLGRYSRRMSTHQQRVAAEPVPVSSVRCGWGDLQGVGEVGERTKQVGENERVGKKKGCSRM